MYFLDGLNDKQLEAVKTLNGPIMVFAGAGSGKTRVITTRIAYAIAKNFCNPEQILGITFTNKAAKEMRERVSKIIGKKGNKTFLSTFHSFSLSILREEIKHLKILKNNFVIYDSNDQNSLIRKIINNGYKELGFNDKLVKSLISKFKSQNILPTDNNLGLQDPALIEIYKKYQESLINYNAMDFDDILIYAYRLLKENMEVRQKWASKFKLIMVDEYQDTSELQFDLINMLTLFSSNIMAVGDDDQTIYTWRGANMNNISSFIDSYKNVKVVKLEQNYRSTQHILNIANAIIKENSERTPKKLWSKIKGEKVEILAYDTQDDEAYNIISKIYTMCSIKKNYNFKNIAILYRSNFMSRSYEEAARLKGVPYKLIGSIKFYDRKEIQLALAYLKILVNKYDQLAYTRAIETPPRGIGAKTINKILDFSHTIGISFFDTLTRNNEINTLTPRMHSSINRFLDIIKFGKTIFNSCETWDEPFDKYLSNAGLYDYFKEHSKNDKMANKSISYIKEFIKGLETYRQRALMEGKKPTINKFLDRISLISDADTLNQNKDAITLMTIHTAKGLEFPIVFFVGLVEGNMPNQRALEDSEKNLAEERRLMYVAITRAKHSLFLSLYNQRTSRGQIIDLEASRFLLNLPKESLKSTLEEAQKDLKLSSNIFMQEAAKQFLDTHE